MNLPKLIILCGYPFAGKSTLTKALMEKLGFVLVGIDEINKERGVGQSTGTGVTPEEWDKTYRQAYERIDQLLREGKNVVYDATNFTKEQRDQPKEIAKKYNAFTKVVFVDVPKEIVWQRLQENRATNSRFDVRDEDFAQVVDNFQRPQEDEDVLVYDGKISVEKWIEKEFGISSVWRGVLIEESVQNVQIIPHIKIIATKVTNLEEEKEKGLFHFHNVEVEGKKLEKVIEFISENIKESWYFHLVNNDQMVVVFHNTVFKSSKDQQEEIENIRNYAHSQGIIAEQLPLEKLFDSPFL